MNHQTLKTKRKPRRKGVATVEFAVCIPILVIVIMGSVEACNMIFLKQKLTEAAFQGALVAMKPASEAADVEARVNAVLAARNIQQTSVSVSGGSFDAIEAGDPFTVTVGAMTAGNRYSPTIISTLTQLETTVSGLKQ